MANLCIKTPSSASLVLIFQLLVLRPRKSDAFDAKIVNTRLTKIFIAIFAPDERLPSSATLMLIMMMLIMMMLIMMMLIMMMVMIMMLMMIIT